jgi:hypothetical protein
VESHAVKGATYRLVVRGELAERFGVLFGRMRLEWVGDTTVLSGPVVDQAELHGYIERIEELGLELLSVEQTSTQRTGRGTEW